MSNFKTYQNPRQSRLEQWRNDITQMRFLNWPYPHIAEWILTEQQLKISSEAIRQFSLIRGIKKGNSTIAPPKLRREKSSGFPQTQDIKPKPDGEFTYEPKPINVARK